MRRLGLMLLVGFVAVGLLAMPGLAKKTASDHGWLGVSLKTVKTVGNKKHELSPKYGALVAEVMDDSPAEKAGLEDGDLIVSLDDETVRDMNDLIDLLEETKPGDNITLMVMRDGQEKALNVTLGAHEKAKNVYVYKRGSKDDDEFTWTSKDDNKLIWKSKEGQKRPYIGVMLEDLNDQLGKHFGVDDGDGALVEEVVEDSPAEKAGLVAGDVIVAIGDDDVEDSGDAVKAVRRAEPGERLTVTVMRDRRQRQVEVEVGERENDYSYYNFSGVPEAYFSGLEGLKGLKGLQGLKMDFFHDGDFDIDFDDGEFEADMEELAEALEELKFEFDDDDMHHRIIIDLDDDARTNKREFRRVLRNSERDTYVEDKELQGELMELRQELKKLREELKKELSEIRKDRD